MFRSSGPNKKPKWQKKENGGTSEDGSDDSAEDETEEDNLETDNASGSEDGDELDADQDDDESDDDGNENASESEDGEYEEKLSEMKKVPKLIDLIVTEEWTGNIDDDTETLKNDFQKYAQGMAITKTKLFKEFKDQFDVELDTKRRQVEEDGVNKSDNEIGQEAYDKAFEEFESRFRDIIREIYQHYDIEEESDSDDNDEDDEEENKEDDEGENKLAVLG